MSRGKDLEDERQLVCFRIANEEYGIGIMQVREIIRLDSITAVPGTPSYVSGIVNLRGNVLPVIDLGRRFGLESSQHSEQKRILVVEMDSRTTGLIVDAVSEALRIPESDIEPAPQILSANVSSRYITGIGKLDGGNRVIILIDAGSILEQEEIEALPGADGRKQAPPAGAQFSVDDDSGQQSNSGEESNAWMKEKGSPESVTDTSAEDVTEIVISAVEKIEAKKKADEQANREKIMHGLMKLKKAELLAKAKKLGLKVSTKMTKKQIVGLIVDTN
ncbi:MAG TPA: chemotaxis protein CheW [Desulfobacteraceae bacterium]|nr:chemotaxis protein CheW [Desulfobacteraceae bacterium]